MQLERMVINMNYVTLGSTGIKVNKNGFGALPIQRLSETEAIVLLKKAYENGITFYDTARGYTDSEKKIGLALSDVRDKIYIATKGPPVDVKTFWENLEISLNKLKTDYIDIYQFHNPSVCHRPGDEHGLYDAMLEAKAKGKIRHIGVTYHRFDSAKEAAESGLYETIQYPFSYLSGQEEIDFVRFCEEKNIGILAMKALAGGLITESAAAYAWLAQFNNVVPIWGIQRENELDEFIQYQKKPPSLSGKERIIIARDTAELSGDYCRGCGYCMPCPVGINVSIASRMSLMVKRAPPSLYLMEDWKKMMKRIPDCTNCGHCEENCPYNLDTRRLMRENWEVYKEII